MPFPVKASQRHKVHFTRRTMISPTTKLNNLLYSTNLAPTPPQPGFVIEEEEGEARDDEDDINHGHNHNHQRRNLDYSSSASKATPPNMATKTLNQTVNVPDLYTSVPPIHDLLNTSSSSLQDATIQECLPFLSPSPTSNPALPPNKHGLPHLLRQKHIAFLHKSLGALPAPYTGADASRPWLLYWALCGLATLGEDVSVYRERVVASVRVMQHPEGGFGGGHGQMSHLAPSYAVMLSLAIVDGGTGEAFRCVDRVGMWRWLGRVKGSSGGFAMSIGGEEDVRYVFFSFGHMRVLLPR